MQAWADLGLHASAVTVVAQLAAISLYVDWDIVVIWAIIQAIWNWALFRISCQGRRVYLLEGLTFVQRDAYANLRLRLTPTCS